MDETADDPGHDNAFFRFSTYLIPPYTWVGRAVRVFLASTATYERPPDLSGALAAVVKP